MLAVCNYSKCGKLLLCTSFLFLFVYVLLEESVISTTAAAGVGITPEQVSCTIMAIVHVACGIEN